jgi:hypothetical protein
VSGGSGEISESGGVAGALALDRFGDDERLPEGNGVPDSLRGIRSSKKVGKSRVSDREVGLFANQVMESNKGMTRIAHSAGNWIVFDAGRRDRRAEYKAMED